MMDRKRHWEKLGAEEEWSDEARGKETLQLHDKNIFRTFWMKLGEKTRGMEEKKGMRGRRGGRQCG